MNDNASDECDFYNDGEAGILDSLDGPEEGQSYPMFS